MLSLSAIARPTPNGTDAARDLNAGRGTERTDGRATRALRSDAGSSRSEADGPAVTVTLSTGTRHTSERLLVYGRPSAVAGSPSDAAAGVQDTDAARMLDRKLAEGRKEVAAIQIRQTKAAAKNAGVLSLLNPAGGLSFAKHAAKTLAHAMETFGRAETAIRQAEDDSVADMDPETVTAIAYDVYEESSLLGLTEHGRQAITSAIARLPDSQTARDDEPDAGSQTGRSTVLVASKRIEALTVVQLQDDSAIRARAAGIETARSTRMGQDSEVIKDGVSGLRYLDRLIDLSIRRLQETGRMDAAATREADEARTAWHDAVASTALAAMPIVQAGYGITPNDED